jgi:hypothetical protein
VRDAGNAIVSGRSKYSKKSYCPPSRFALRRGRLLKLSKAYGIVRIAAC